MQFRTGIAGPKLLNLYNNAPSTYIVFVHHRDKLSISRIFYTQRYLKTFRFILNYYILFTFLYLNINIIPNIINEIFFSKIKSAHYNINCVILANIDYIWQTAVGCQNLFLNVFECI